MSNSSNVPVIIGSIVVALGVLIGIICLAISITVVPVGYEGVVYKMNGGVSGEVLSQGWHLVAPTKRVKTFTVSNEQLILTKDSREGSKEDESFKVATSDDASLAISFQMSYRFIPEQITDTYKKFKGMNGEDIVSNRVKTVLKSKVSEVTTNYSMMDIYSGDRSKINNQLTSYLNKAFSSAYGIEVLDASIIDAHPDKELQRTIDNRVKALQQKQQAKAEQERVKVEVETQLIQAEGEAKVKIKKAEGEAKANKVLSESITDELIRMKEAEARKEHGWVTVQGAGTVVTENK